MFRKNLLLTTALVVAGALSFLVRPAALAKASRDHNHEFLCTYGGDAVSHFASHSSTYFYSTWTHVAVPIIGRGQTVDRILVGEKGDVPYGGQFSVGIYSNSPSGVPGNLIASGVGEARRECRLLTISIAPTRLSPKTTYWIEERIHLQHYAKAYWESGSNTKQKAYAQAHRYSSFSSVTRSSYTSPWIKLSKAPYFRLR